MSSVSAKGLTPYDTSWKEVLITQRLDRISGIDEVRECLDSRWGPFLAANQLFPVPALSGVDPRRYFEQRPISAVVLSGGNSLSSVEPAPENLRRDRFEEQIIRLALDSKTPIIGVCRGMQLLTAFFGGELAPIENHVRTEHSVSFVPDSIFRCILGDSMNVNSFHGYGVRSLPAELESCGTAPDGSVEALQHRTLPIVALMWHPERRHELLPAELQLFHDVIAGELKGSHCP